MSRNGYLTVFFVAAVGMLAGEVIYLLFGRFVRPVQAGVRAPTAVIQPSAVPADVQYRRNVALLIFFGINILFWMAFKQKGNTLAQWARDRTDLVAPEWLVHALQWVRLDTRSCSRTACWAKSCLRH